MGRFADLDIVEDMLKDCINNAFERRDFEVVRGLNLAILQLRNVPTAYDVEKVVEQLEEEKGYSYADFSHYINEYELSLDSEYDDFFHKGLGRAIDIIRAGRQE